VVVRSGVNAQSGGRTRLSAMIHSLTLGAAVLLASEHIATIPLPALAGLLCVIGLRLIELGELRHLLRHNKVEALAFLVACAGTVSGHLLWGLVAGITLSALGHLFDRLARPKLVASRITIRRTQSDHEGGIRAVLPSHRGAARRPEWMEGLPRHHGWLANINHEPVVAPTAFIHPQASVIGNVVLGDHVHVAAGSSIRADEGAPFFLGNNTNVQDGVVIHALQKKWVRVGNEEWAVYVGRNVSMAHGALVHGPCYVGDDTFIGFKAVVHDSIVGSRCFIGIGATVVGVEIPDGRYVPHGSIIASQDAVDALPAAAEAQHDFNDDVVHVNRGLAVAYQSSDERMRRALFEVRHHNSDTRVDAHESAWERPTRGDLLSRF